MESKWNILAIWPEYPNLSQYHNIDARQLYDTTLNYMPLRGQEATRTGIVRALSHGSFNILEIVTHGENGSINLTDGLVSPGWWGRLAQTYPLELVVMLACESSTPIAQNVTQALLNAGVNYVISADRQLDAMDAIKFTSIFYSNLVKGQTIKEAYNWARLVMTQPSIEMVKLHERKIVTENKDDAEMDDKTIKILLDLLKEVKDTQQEQWKEIIEIKSNVRSLKDVSEIRLDKLEKRPLSAFNRDVREMLIVGCFVTLILSILVDNAIHWFSTLF